MRRQPTSTAYSGLRKQFIALVGAQLLLLVGLAAPKAYTLCHGQVVTLEATLYDPNDPFRGEYADLSFSDTSIVPTPKLDFKKGETVYVTLSKSRTGTWSASSISRDRTTLKTGQVALKGTTITDTYANGEKADRFVTVSYGFEHLFVPQGSSNKMTITKDSPLIAQVAVDPSGEACIKQVSFKGHRVFDATNLIHPFSSELF